jgi:hypothetical protein
MNRLKIRSLNTSGQAFLKNRIFFWFLVPTRWRMGARKNQNTSTGINELRGLAQYE